MKKKVCGITWRNWYCLCKQKRSKLGYIEVFVPKYQLFWGMRRIHQVKEQSFTSIFLWNIKNIISIFNYGTLPISFPLLFLLLFFFFLIFSTLKKVESIFSTSYCQTVGCSVSTESRGFDHEFEPRSCESDW